MNRFLSAVTALALMTAPAFAGQGRPMKPTCHACSNGSTDNFAAGGVTSTPVVKVAPPILKDGSGKMSVKFAPESSRAGKLRD